MAKVLQPITACLKKANSSEEDGTSEGMKSSYDKNTTKTVSQPSLLWRMTSQAYNVGSGVVGVGVGSIKWAASTTYNVGSGVVSATQTVASKVVPSSVISATQTVVAKVVPSAVPKPKKE